MLRMRRTSESRGEGSQDDKSKRKQIRSSRSTSCHGYEDTEVFRLEASKETPSYDFPYRFMLLAFSLCLLPLQTEAFSAVTTANPLWFQGRFAEGTLGQHRSALTESMTMMGTRQLSHVHYTGSLRLHKSNVHYSSHFQRQQQVLPSWRHGVRHSDSLLTPMRTSSSAAGNSTDATPDENSGWGFLPKVLQNSFVQFLVCVGLYVFHVFVLCRHSLTIPLNIMSAIGFKEAVSVPWESVVGTVILACMAAFGGKKLRSSMSQSLSGTALLEKEKLPTIIEPERKKDLPETFILLGLAYLGSGYVGQAIDLILCACAALGAPLTLGMCRALQVLLSHLFWVVLGSQILQARTGDFYTSKKWFRFDMLAKNLFISTIAGYWLTSYISTIAININELLNMADLPGLKQLHEMLNQLPESATETVLDGLKNPESNDLAARVVGAVGPCFTGPIWEEVLYRGFLLQALTLFMKLPTAVDVSSLVFALNHMNARAFAHLFIVGWLWSVFYIKSRNLMVPILIHMMWNGRTFMAPI